MSGALSNSLRYLAFGTPANPASSGGARAANKSTLDEDAWVESSSQVFLEAGRQNMKAGNFEGAIAQFNQALDSAAEDEIPEIHYYLADASSLNGDLRGAWRHLAGLKPGASDRWAGDFVLLKAKLLEDSSAYSEAVDWLEANDLSQDPPRAQLYFFLLALGHRGSGDDVNAKKAFAKVESISADSGLGRAAAELMK